MKSEDMNRVHDRALGADRRTAYAWQLLCVFGAFLILAGGWAAPAQAARTVGGQQSAFSIQVGQGRLLNFEQPVTNVFVADPKVADVQIVSPTWVYLFGKKSGATNLIALDGQAAVRASLRLQVSASDQTARQALQAAGSQPAIKVRTVGNQLVVSGRTDSIEQAVDTQAIVDQNAPPGGSVINNATYAGASQINIRVRFAEVSRNELRRYGVNWDALVNSGSFSFGLVTGSSLISNASNVVSAGYNGGGDSVQALINALQSDGLVKILAEPNITTVTGQTASFLAGGEIPVPVPVNRDLIGVQYKKYGVSLLCTPTLLPDGRISMQVKPEVSSVVSGSNVQIAGYSIPALQLRSADTVVQVGSGQTFAIGGLFQASDSNDIDQLPVIGDIPIIGQLFRSRRFQHKETELVMLITPYLVAPSSDRSPNTPLDSAADAADERPVIRQASVADQGFGFYVHE